MSTLRISTRNRNIAKKIAIAYWLLLFKYSDAKTLSLLIKQSQTSSSRFLSELIKNKFLRSVVNQSGKKILHMGPESWNMVGNESSVKKKKSDFTLSKNFKNVSNTSHNINLQRHIIILLQKNSDFCVIERPRDLEFYPDAFLVNKHKEKIAVEMENLAKKPSRVYFKLGKMLDAIESGNLSFVIYAFTDRPTFEYYQKLFDKKSWPKISEIVEPGKKSLITIGRFTPSEIAKKRFKFEMIA